MRNVLEYLEHSEDQYPDKTAFADIDTSCTYHECAECARRIGTGIARAQGVRRAVPVLQEKGVAAMEALMGAVYAGCFYVQLDPRYPVSRLVQVLGTLHAEVILTTHAQDKLLQKLDFSGKILYMEDLEQTKADQELLREIRSQTLDIDPLYTNFTSGSTGVPKGVVVSHRSVIDFIDHFTELFGITDQDVIGNQAPFDFDVSVKDIYSTLKTGATMQIIPKKLFSFPVKLLDFLVEREVTTLIWAVSALCILTTLDGFAYKVPDKIRRVLFSGEAMPVRHLNLWKKYLPDAMYVNLYGPTEITCNCTYYIVDREFEEGENIPMGKPFPNEKVFLLDGSRLVTKAGEKGEICVSGTALALGYFDNAGQTGKAFVQNPLNPYYPETIYRTGDLGYYNKQGELVFASRNDFQIKHMGHRIELGEIELAIMRQEGIQRVCCIYDQEKILAFYDGTPEKRDIVKGLRELLPAYMLPNVWKRVEHMPLNHNGKIDRKALLEEL